MLKGILAESVEYKREKEDLDGTHGPDEASHHCEEEGDDGHQHAGLAEPPEDSCQGCSLSPSTLQLVVPQRFESGTGNHDDKLYELTAQPNIITSLLNFIYWMMSLNNESK